MKTKAPGFSSVAGAQRRFPLALVTLTSVKPITRMKSHNFFLPKLVTLKPIPVSLPE